MVFPSFEQAYSHFLHMINIRYKTTFSKRPLFLGAVEWSYNERRLYITVNFTLPFDS